MAQAPGEFAPAIRARADSLHAVDPAAGDGAFRRAMALGAVFAKAQPDSALVHYRTAARLAADRGRALDRWAAVSAQVGLSRGTGEYDAALPLLDTALLIARELGDSLRVASAYNERGLNARRRLAFDEATAAYHAALPLLRDSGDTAAALLAKVYIGLGRVHDERGDHSTAIDYYRRGERVAVAHPDHVSRALRGSAIYFAGTAAMTAGRVGDAEAAMERYGAFAAERADGRPAAEQHGVLDLFLRDTALAHRHFDAAATEAEGRGDARRYAIAVANLLPLVTDRAGLPGALARGRLALSRVGDDRETRGLLLEGMAAGLAGAGRHDSAYAYLQRHRRLRDSLVGEEQAGRIARLEVEYKTAEAERAAAVSELRLAGAQRARLLLWVGLAVALACGTAAAAFYRHRARGQRALAEQRAARLAEERLRHERERDLERVRATLETQERERARVARDLHDGLGGLLASTRAHLEHGLRAVDAPAAEAVRAVQLLDEAYGEVRRVAHAMMPQALSMHGLRAACEDLAAELEAAGLRVDFHVIGAVDELLRSEATVHVYRILRELVANTLKHAGASAVILQLIGERDRLAVVYEDDGRGLGSDAREGLGLGGIDARVRLLGGELDIVTGDDGTSVTILLPVSAGAAPPIPQP